MNDRNDAIRVTRLRIDADVASEVADLMAPSGPDVDADVLEVRISDSTPASTLEAISDAAERQDLGLRLTASDPDD